MSLSYLIPDSEMELWSVISHRPLNRTRMKHNLGVQYIPKNVLCHFVFVLVMLSGTPFTNMD